jgi:hypothetical protein
VCASVHSSYPVREVNFLPFSLMKISSRKKPRGLLTLGCFLRTVTHVQSPRVPYSLHTHLHCFRHPPLCGLQSAWTLSPWLSFSFFPGLWQSPGHYLHSFQSPLLKSL